MANKGGQIYVIGLGPGSSDLLTPQACKAIAASEVIIGYQPYVETITDLVVGKEIIASGMRQEIARARTAVELAAAGRRVAIVSSGDPGIYAMAGPLFEVLHERGWRPDDCFAVEVIPGIPALSAMASLLGAPLMHDFAAISLSDLLTPWEVIARRLELAAEADFVIVLYNPRSSQRVRQLALAQQIISRHRSDRTPVGIVRQAYRTEQKVITTDLAHMLEHKVDMLSIVAIGNSATFSFAGLMVTPRGYETGQALKSASHRTSNDPMISQVSEH